MKMKKIVVLFLMIFAVSVTNAQDCFLGGSVGFNTSSNDQTSFIIAPEVGKILSDKLWVGVGVGFGMDMSEALSVKTTQTAFEIAPYARYYMLRLNKFALAAQGELGFAYATSKVKAGDVSTDGPKATVIGFNVAPYLTYDLTDRVVLHAKINGFNFGINHSSVKDGDSTTSFGFGAQTSSLVDVSALTIGALIKF